MVMSDHGFHSFRREVNLNTWLVQNGYMVVHGQSTEKTLAGPLRPRQVLRGGGLVADEGLRGGPRPDLLQPAGPREPGHRLRRRRSTAQLQEEIRGEARCRSPTPRRASGSSRTSTGGTTSTRASTSRWRPTCRSGFLDGYRVGWQDTLGTIRRAVVENNNRKWSRRPLRDRHRDQPRGLLLQPEDREPRAAHHGPRALGPEAARGRRSRPTTTASPSGDRRPPAARPRRGAAGGAGGRPLPARRPRPTRSGCARSRSGARRSSRSSRACAARRRASSARWSSWSSSCACAPRSSPRSRSR